MTVREWIFNKVDTNEKSFLKRLLISRGIKTEEEMREFLNPLEFTPYSPNVFTDMPKAVERLAKAIDNQEKIVIYGDFDADGVTSTSLLYRTFSYLGANINYFIPIYNMQLNYFVDKFRIIFIKKSKNLILLNTFS